MPNKNKEFILAKQEFSTNIGVIREDLNKLVKSMIEFESQALIQKRTLSSLIFLNPDQKVDIEELYGLVENLAEEYLDKEVYWKDIISSLINSEINEK